MLTCPPFCFKPHFSISWIGETCQTRRGQSQSSLLSLWFYFFFLEKMSPCSIFGGTTWITGQPVPWLQYCRSSCKAQPPCCPSSPQARYPGTVHTRDAYKLLIVFLSEASPNSLTFPKQKQIWIAELARKTNTNPALSENTARCHE